MNKTYPQASGDKIDTSLVITNLMKLIFQVKALYRKLFSKIFYLPQLINIQTSAGLIKHFGGAFGHNTHVKSGHLGFGLIHYSIIRNSRPERVLCIGSQRGFIPAVCGLACRDNKHGHVDFVDAGKDEKETGNWGGDGFWKTHNANIHFGYLGLDKYLTTYVTTSQEFAERYPDRKYEYIYIDANHSYEGAKSDFNKYWSKLASGGYMAFHDIKLKGLSRGEEFGVWKLWREIKEPYKFTIDSYDNAIGIIRKDED